MSQASPIPGSFRDPSGHVLLADGRILRTVTEHALEEFRHVRNQPAFANLVRDGAIIEETVVPEEFLEADLVRFPVVLEHPHIDFISHPYEWPFQALKDAALLHLELQLALLEDDIVLTDASAYNVQFIGARPQFIDSLSFRRYVDGEFWSGHRQFCEQFLNPLLFTALKGVPFNAWFRGSLEGITASELDSILGIRDKLNWNVLTHVVLQAKLQAKKNAVNDAKKSMASKRLTKPAYRQILTSLHAWISKLRPKTSRSSVWRDYATDNSYTSDEQKEKEAFVGKYCSAVAPDMLIDLGCNTGHYAEIAVRHGARKVIGFDCDPIALDRAYARARDRDLDFLPLYMDAANPPPDQGWQEHERLGFKARVKADALLALALVHHLAIARNIPLTQAIDWITATATSGVIEFVPKDDPMVRQLLSLRSDIFEDYTREAFEAALSERTRIVESTVISASGRTLYWFART
jgi:ribosomal protein L11 methylase PrmA